MKHNDETSTNESVRNEITLYRVLTVSVWLKKRGDWNQWLLEHRLNVALVFRQGIRRRH